MVHQPTLFDLFDTPPIEGTPTIPRHVLDVSTIYHEPAIEEFARGREILARFPDAERIEVPSHWNIPALHGNEGGVRDWLKVKRETLVVGVKKGMSFLPYTRSCDWVAPSHSNGCALACAYCVAAGTLISTPRGPVPVEQIRDGDEVSAFDRSSGRLVAARVCGTAAREAGSSLEIRVGRQVLRATAEHPIWTRRGWVEAGHLAVGDEVLCGETRTARCRSLCSAPGASAAQRAGRGGPAERPSHRSIGSGHRAPRSLSPTLCRRARAGMSSWTGRRSSWGFPALGDAPQSDGPESGGPVLLPSTQGSSPRGSGAPGTRLRTRGTSAASRGERAGFCQSRTGCLPSAAPSGCRARSAAPPRRRSRRSGGAPTAGAPSFPRTRLSRSLRSARAARTSRSSRVSSLRLTFHVIDRIQHIDGPLRVYNFHVPGPESYVANGIVTHNCYVPRRKGFANPISTFVNIEQITRAIVRHAQKSGPKGEPTIAGEAEWIYELGCNSDLSLDASICDNARDLIALFRRLPNARATFATKFVNRDLLGYDPQRKTRMRFSLMPPRMSRVVDVRTSTIAARVAAIDEFFEAGYEVNVNFAPVIFTDDWEEQWRELFQMVDATIGQGVKRQLTCEIIFLTHNAALHEVNQQWHPRGEAALWQPEIQEPKISEGGMENLRYKRGFKGELVRRFQEILREEMPYCRVRYAF